MSRIILEHIPTKKDAYDLINGFFNHNHDIKYTTQDTDNTLIVTFSSTEHALNLMKYINLKKPQNKLYFDLKIRMVMINSKPEKRTKNRLSPLKKGRKEKSTNKKSKSKESKGNKNEQGINKSKEKPNSGRSNHNIEYLLTENNKQANYLKTKDSIHFLRKNLGANSPENKQNKGRESYLNNNLKKVDNSKKLQSSLFYNSINNNSRK